MEIISCHRATSYRDLFQENLVVWKSLDLNLFYFHPWIVSGELSSMEIKKVRKILRVLYFGFRRT